MDLVTPSFSLGKWEHGDLPCALGFSLETTTSGHSVFTILHFCVVSTVGYSPVSAASPTHGQYRVEASGAAVNSLLYRYFRIGEEYCWCGFPEVGLLGPKIRANVFC